MFRLRAKKNGRVITPMPMSADALARFDPDEFWKGR
jgi:hypothetical protein